MTGPAYRWPGGADAAVLVTFDVDAEAPHLWRARANGARLGELEQRRFGPRQGVFRLLELLAGHDLRVTFYVPGFVARQHPAVVAEIVVGREPRGVGEELGDGDAILAGLAERRQVAGLAAVKRRPARPGESAADWCAAAAGAAG